MKFRAALTRLRVSLILLALVCIGLLLADRLFPFPFPAHHGYASVVTDTDGVPLRSFADSRGVWRYPVDPDEVSPRYLQALLNYEDRWFYHHPGVNPLALLRAGWQALSAGRIISGGSTLTMQVARLLDPVPRSIDGKLRQILRAMQLEWHLDKRQILSLYLDYAPFGGPIEGVQAASYSYLGKSAQHLSHGEAALLAVLPQRPSRLRPDRHPQRAQKARDKVIRRMLKQQVWSPQAAREAIEEPVAALYEPNPQIAALLSRRLREPGQAVPSTLWAGLQATLEDRLTAWSSRLPEHSSAAVLVVENRSMAVRAYLGSLDFHDPRRYGHVDMIRARRSPGSTLKPFLYGLALDQGLIHSGSLLADAPLRLDSGYRPGNFSGNFSGPVSAEQALQRSLNPPAVDLLERLGPAWFRGRLQDAGLQLQLPPGANANLSIILGGTATRLEQLVAAYSALGRDGLSGELRFRPQQTSIDHRLLSPGAAWIVRRILEDNPRRPANAGGQRLAWKTGTSYGFRDAWAIGVSADYTIGVWVGRPDGTPTPGQYGAITAAPLLFNMAAALPGNQHPASLSDQPANVSRVDTCWPLGDSKQNTHPDLCQQTRAAWVLNDTIPPTLPPRDGRKLQLTRWVDADSGYLQRPLCPVQRPARRDIARWPGELEPWLSNRQLEMSQIPEADPACEVETRREASPLQIIGLHQGSRLRPAGDASRIPAVELNSQGGIGAIHWMINGQPVGRSQSGVPLRHQFRNNGSKEITAFDETGNWHRITVEVSAVSSPDADFRAGLRAPTDTD